MSGETTEEEIGGMIEEVIGGILQEMTETDHTNEENVREILIEAVMITTRGGEGIE